jgi:integrase
MMPKKAKELGPLAVSRLATPGLHFVGGVAGLALQVLPSGGRSWVLRARVGGKRRDMGLGGFPDVPLAHARETARTARAKIRQGVDPIEESRTARSMLRMAQANAVPFRRAAAAYIETHAAGWANAKHAQQWTNTLTTHAFPHIGDLLVRDIELPQILSVLEPIWRTKTETASRVRNRVEAVLNWATTKGYREGLNPARWSGHLENILPSPAKIKKEKHHPALSVSDAGAFLAALRTHGGMGARALEFGILTAARSGEIRGATWGEINLDSAEWCIPAARMKMKNDHRVPLSDAAVDLLKALLVVPGTTDKLPKRAATALVFPAPRGGTLSDGTLNAVISRMNEETEQPRWIDPKDGREVVQHGFRSTFRDWVSERTNYPNEVAEMALAHAVGNKVEAAYRRGDLLDKRRQMMDDWAAFCAMVEPASNNVVPLRKAQAT